MYLIHSDVGAGEQARLEYVQVEEFVDVVRLQDGHVPKRLAQDAKTKTDPKVFHYLLFGSKTPRH